MMQATKQGACSCSALNKKAQRPFYLHAFLSKGVHVMGAPSAVRARSAARFSNAHNNHLSVQAKRFMHPRSSEALVSPNNP